MSQRSMVTVPATCTTLQKPIGSWDHEKTHPPIANPMSRFPKYSGSRKSWGVANVPSVIVEIEDENGLVGIGLSTGGEAAAFIIERHLALFVEGHSASDRTHIWLVPHGCGVYGYYMAMAFDHIGLAEFMMMSERADKIEANFGKMFKREPLPERGYIELPTTPGFGLELNRDELNLIRPYDRSRIHSADRHG